MELDGSSKRIINQIDVTWMGTLSASIVLKVGIKNVVLLGTHSYINKIWLQLLVVGYTYTVIKVGLKLVTFNYNNIQVQWCTIQNWRESGVKSYMESADR